MKRFLLLFGTSALLLLASGCGTSEPATGQVTGKVLLGDKLLHSGTVTFVDARKKETPTAISPDGRYRVSRVAVGTARVTLVSHPPSPFTKEEPISFTRTTACDVRRGEQEHDLVFEP